MRLGVLRRGLRLAANVAGLGVGIDSSRCRFDFS